MTSNFLDICGLRHFFKIFFSQVSPDHSPSCGYQRLNFTAFLKNEGGYFRVSPEKGSIAVILATAKTYIFINQHIYVNLI